MTHVEDSSRAPEQLDRDLRTPDQNGSSPRRAVRKRRRKMHYAAPQLSAIPRVVPVGYEELKPEFIQASPLRRARRDQGLSMRDLAERSGISASTIYRIEQGKTEPRPFVVYALSRALNCSPWEISEFRQIMAEISLPR